MLPMSVDTIAPSGIARSSSRSICRGCMCAESFATSSDHASFSCVQPSSSRFPRRLLGVDRRAGARRWLSHARQRACPAAAPTARAPRPSASPQMPTEIGFTRPEHLRVGVDLDDLRLLRPVVDAVLRQRAERPEARAEREHDVGLGDQLHRRLAALVAERAAPQRMPRRERVVVQVAACTPAPAAARRARSASALPSAMTTPPPARITGNCARREQLRRFVEALLAAGAALDRERPRDLALDVAVEEVARDVELRRPHLEHARGRTRAPVSSAMRALLLTCAWYLVIFEKIGSCSVSWKPPRPSVALPVSGVIDDDRRMRPERGRGRRDEVGDARAVLRDADAVAAGHARVAVGHVAARPARARPR